MKNSALLLPLAWCSLAVKISLLNPIDSHLSRNTLTWITPKSVSIMLNAINQMLWRTFSINSKILLRAQAIKSWLKPSVKRMENDLSNKFARNSTILQRRKNSTKLFYSPFSEASDSVIFSRTSWCTMCLIGFSKATSSRMSKNIFW